VHHAQVIDSPDKGAQDGWKGLLKYSRTLSHMTQAPWHGKEPPCLHFDVQVIQSRVLALVRARTLKTRHPHIRNHLNTLQLFFLLQTAQFERSIKSSALLERTKLESSSLPDHQAVIELANSLANVLRLVLDHCVQKSVAPGYRASALLGAERCSYLRRNNLYDWNRSSKI